MTNFEQLLEIIDGSDQVVGGVRDVAEYMSKKNYCCNMNDRVDEICDYAKVNNSCVKCWMMHLTDEYKDAKEKK